MADDDTTREEVVMGYDPAVADAKPVFMTRDDTGRFTIAHHDVTQPMRLHTGGGLHRRTIDAGFDRAYQRALTRREQRRQRVDTEVRRHLREVADEWRITNSVPLPMRDAGQAELARGIGTAIVIVCAAVVLAVFAIAMGLAP